MNRFWKRSVSLLLTLILCAGLLSGLSTGAAAATLEERTQALVATALAYYDKGHSIQYDGTTICSYVNRSDGGKTRSTNQVAPEYATPNETMFTVCSDYAHQCYYETFRYQLAGSAGGCYTSKLVKISEGDPIFVWRFDDGKGKTQAEAVEELLSVAKAGDVFTIHRKKGTGHTMLFVGDVTGDGQMDLLHSSGSHMKTDERIDVREYKTKDDPDVDPRCGTSFGPTTKGGSIRTADAASYCRKSFAKDTIQSMNLVRPLNVITDADYPITPAAAYRVSHPRLAIDRTLNKTRFNSAFTGETVTMTLKLSNSSDKEYTVPVTEKAPAGAKIKTPFAGAELSGDTMKLDVALKAGEEKTFTAEYEITAKRGETVVFDGGSVGDIPSNSIPIAVGGKKLTAEENAKLAAAAKGEYDNLLKDAKADNVTLGDVVYQKILGLNVRLPAFKTVSGKLTKITKGLTGNKPTHVFLTKDEVAAEDRQAFETLVPSCRGGFSIWYRFGIDRCSDPRDMHVEPGDVIVRSGNMMSTELSEQPVYLGDGKYLSYDREKNAYPIVEEPEFFRCLFYKIFYVLRPTLACDDVHALPALSEPAAPEKIKFTDVKESDWFYTYVKDLTDNGTVSGMTETTYAPDGNLTYGQAIKLVALAVGEKEQAPTGKHWASGYVALAKSREWIDRDVNPDTKVTRLEFCKIAARAKGQTAQPSKNPFTDTKDKEVLALYKENVINGMTETTFQPGGLLTRAQIAKIIWTLRGI